MFWAYEYDLINWIECAVGGPHLWLFIFCIYLTVLFQVLESCVKNCGSLVHDEIGTKAYMEQLREAIKTTQHENVKNKLLELIQAWAYAFRNIPKYRAVQVWVIKFLIYYMTIDKTKKIIKLNCYISHK